MRNDLCRLWLGFCVTLLITTAAQAQSPQVVFFDQWQNGGAKPEPLWGHLTLPAAAEPVPAVVLMHGCGGIQNSHLSWAEILNKAGYATLLLDSMGPRSIFNGCLGTDRRLVPPNLARDALGALAHLATIPEVDPDRIAVIGWSMGGTALMAAIAENGIASRFDKTFRAAIAFYPYCTGRRSLNTDLLILTGEVDDWTPPGPCQDQQQATPEQITMITYPGAYHAFDEEALGQGFSFPGNDGKMHLLKYNRPAHMDSIEQVTKFLAARFAE